MTDVLQFLHFLGAAILVGGEPLIAVMAIRAEKDDQALEFFVRFLGSIAIYMWVGTGLALVGGIGWLLVLGRSISLIFGLKLVAFGFVVVLSIALGMRIPRVQAAADRGLAGLRNHPDFKVMDALSRVNLGLVILVLILSVLL